MKRAVFTPALATLVLALAATAASAAQFYKWKDQNGVWQYTTTPPPAGAESSTVSVQGDAKTDMPAIEPNQVDSPAETADADKATQSQQISDMTDEIREKRRGLCENAKQRVEVLRTNAVVEMEGKQLSPEEQSTELSKAQSAVNVYCAS